MFSVQMTINLTMIFLLIITILYAFKLNARLKSIRDARDDLFQIIQQFNEATQKANNSVQVLKKTAKEVEGKIQAHTNRAEELKSDLAFLLKKADKAATNLEKVALNQKSFSVETAPPASLKQEPNRLPNKRETPHEAIIRAMREIRE